MKLSLSALVEGLPVVVAQAASPSLFDGIKQMAPILVIFAIFYFLLIAPMRKQRRQLQEVISNLQKGDRVITNGGLHGEVAAVEDSVVILRVADNVKVKVSKSAVAGLEPAPGSSTPAKGSQGKGTK